MPSELPYQLAFRVAVVAGGLWLVSLFSYPLHTLIGLALLLAAVTLLFSALLAKRESTRTRRRWLAYAATALVAALALWSGIVVTFATPMLVLAAVCGALGLVGVLGTPNDPQPE